MQEAKNRIWHVFCDESRQTQARFMVFGGVVIEGRHLLDFVRIVQAWRERESMNAELKWTKVSRGKLAEYKSLVDGFFRNARRNVISFKSVVFDTHEIDYRAFHKGDRDLGFYKFMYQFLLHRFGPYASGAQTRLTVNLHRRCSPYRLSTLRAFLNRGIRKSYSQSLEPVAAINGIDSKTHSEACFLQIADILMGAVGYHWNELHVRPGASVAKCSLADHIAAQAGLQSLRTNTPRDRRDFNIWQFRLQKKSALRI